MKKLKNYFKAFTLVELIIVITILAILATIAFISFQNYTKDARDGNRVATITQIKKGLELSQIKTGKYPQPEGNNVLTGSINNQILTYVGEIGENISRLIKMNKTPIDPLTKSNLVYGTNSNNRYYQIATILENPTSYNSLITQTYANTNFLANVEGNYPGYIKFSSGANNEETRIANIPSLIFNNTGSVNLLSDTTYFVVNKRTNLPYKINQTTPIQNITPNNLIKEITLSSNSTLTGINITNLTKDNFGEYFTGVTLESFNLKGQDITNIENIKETLKTTILGTTPTPAGQTPKTPGQCGVNADTFAHTVNDFTNKDDISYCSVGTPTTKPDLPAQGAQVNWTCTSPDGGTPANCTATKLNPNEEVVSCTGKPANSVYFGSSETHDVTVNYGSPAPTANYTEIPIENSCDFSCANGFTHQSGQCNDITPPPNGSFTMPETTNSTTVALTITCPTDVISGTNIQMYISGAGLQSGGGVWENCVSSKNITLTNGDGSKTITMKWRDLANNETSPVFSENITLNSVINLIMYDSARRWSDGSYALSCNGYKNPAGIYEYSGSTGDGVYWVKPDLNPAFKVYCDMTTDGGGWTLVLQATATTMYTLAPNSNEYNLSNISTLGNTAKLSDSTINYLKNIHNNRYRFQCNSLIWYVTSSCVFNSTLQVGNIPGHTCLKYSDTLNGNLNTASLWSSAGGSYSFRGPGLYSGLMYPGYGGGCNDNLVNTGVGKLWIK